MVSLQSIIWVFLLNNFSRVINLLLTKLARDRTGRISALGLFCTDLAALGPYCQDLGPIFSQYGPRAWLIRCIYILITKVLSSSCFLVKAEVFIACQGKGQSHKHKTDKNGNILRKRLTSTIQIHLFFKDKENAWANEEQIEKKRVTDCQTETFNLMKRTRADEFVFVW